MQIDQFTSVLAYMNLLFRLDASPKWQPHVAAFISRILANLTSSTTTTSGDSNDQEKSVVTTTKRALQSHTFLHALAYVTDTSILNGVWIEYKSGSLYDGAGILRSRADFKLGLTRIFYCDSYSQNPLTYFISLIDPETRKNVHLKVIIISDSYFYTTTTI